MLTPVSVAEPVVLPAIMPGDSFAVPLHLTSWRLQARPKGLGVFFCKAPIHWTNVVKTAEVSSSKRECHSMDTEKSRFFRWVSRSPAVQVALASLLQAGSSGVSSLSTRSDSVVLFI